MGSVRHDRTPLTAVQAAVLDGLMLGDGCLTQGPNSTNAVLQITRASRDLAYLDWTAEVFAGRLTPRGVATRNVFDARTGRTYQSSVLRSRADPMFTEARERWYPDGHKQIPDDLVLARLAVAVWLADDGSITRASRRSPDVKFATQGFDGTEVEHLAGLLTQRYGAGVRTYSETGTTQRTIRLFGDAARSLLRDIDPVFPPMPRKSDRWRLTELLHVKPATPACPRCAGVRVYRWARTRQGVQQFKCQECMRVFREDYERPWRDPAAVKAGA